MSRSSLAMSETESEADEMWQQHLEELGERLNAENDRTGFLRMVNRNHLWNASSYSINSLFSNTNTSVSNSNTNGLRGPPGSGAGDGAMLGGVCGASTRSKSSVSLSSISMSKDSMGGSKAPLSSLYEMLISPMEEMLQSLENHQKPVKDLVLVLQGDLYLIPFAILRKSQITQALYERFHIIAVPSIKALQANATINKQQHKNSTDSVTSCLAVGNPKLPQSVIDTWQWGQLQGAEQEVRMMCDMMGSHPITGANATKDSVLQNIEKCEVVHFATHISWKLAAIVLSSHGAFSTTSTVGGNLERMDLNESNSDMDNLHGPSLAEFLLSAADILNHKINAKLVVLSSGHSEDRAGRINSDGVVGLTRAFLAAGAQCVLFSLWPIPDLASRSFFKAFYTSLLQGAKTSVALSEAMRAVQTSKTFTHPSNWSGWVLVGSDIRLTNKVALMGQALSQLLQSPSTAREGMRVVLHLVEKSLQRIRMNQRNAMYTTVMSIENKVGQVLGWKDLLTAVGFRFEVGNKSLPDAVFFPTSDPGDRLTQCSASLQALLGLTVPTLTAISKMTEQSEIGESLTTLMRDVNQKYSQGDTTIQIPVSVQLWRAPGCHEFLASLGLDLVDVGRQEVTIKAGKQANRRLLQFALQALVAIFDTQSFPNTLLLDASNSMESLTSSTSNTSTDNFSKGSSPPSSPTAGRKKTSFFNPAEVDKLPSAATKANQGKLVKGRSHGPGTTVALHLNHQDTIRRKYSSPSASDDDALQHADQGDDFEDNSSWCSNSGVPKYSKASSLGGGSSRSGSIRSAASSTRRIIHQPSLHPYSTSASDSEDAHVPENNLSKSLSQSRTSLVSQSSTLTFKSTGSGGGAFRRNKARSSVASTRSSASDKTITNDTDHNTKQEEYLWDSRENFSLEQQDDENHKGVCGAINTGINTATLNKGEHLKDMEDDKTANLICDEEAKVLDDEKELLSPESLCHNSSSQHINYKNILTVDNELSLPSTIGHPRTDQNGSENGEMPPSGVITQRKLLFEKSNCDDSNLNTCSLDGDKQIFKAADSNFRSAFAPIKAVHKPICHVFSSEQKLWFKESGTEGKEIINGTSLVTSQMDPALIAKKVMMETVQHKVKLDAMQKWSSQNLKQKLLSNSSENVSFAVSKTQPICDNRNTHLNNNDQIKIDSLNENKIYTSSNPSNSSTDKQKLTIASSRLASVSLPHFLISNTKVPGEGDSPSLKNKAATEIIDDKRNHMFKLRDANDSSLSLVDGQITTHDKIKTNYLNKDINNLKYVPEKPEQPTNNSELTNTSSLQTKPFLGYSSFAPQKIEQKVGFMPNTNAAEKLVSGCVKKLNTQNADSFNTSSAGPSDYTVNGNASHDKSSNSSTVRPPPPYSKPKPILANSLQDNNSTFTIAAAATPGAGAGANKLLQPVSGGVPDLQDEIIERQLNRLNEGLATIPEYGITEFSSTDTDYEHIQNLPRGSTQNKGALKSARTRTALRQRIVKFKDEVDGNLESPTEDGMTTSASDFIQVRQAMARTLSIGTANRFSDDDFSSQSESEYHSSFLNSSFSSHDGSLTAPIIPGMYNVQKKVNSIMQTIRPQSPGKIVHTETNLRTQQQMGNTPPQMQMIMKPQSPLGSSLGSVTPPYIPPSLGTPPYKPPSPALALNSQFMHQVTQGITTSQQSQQHRNMPRYVNATTGYNKELPPYPPQKNNHPVTTAPKIPPRQGGVTNETAGNGKLHTAVQSSASYNKASIGYSSLPSSPEVLQQMKVAGQQDYNSPSNLHLASMKLYSSEGVDSSSGHNSSPASTPTSTGPPPSISGRLPISTLVQQQQQLSNRSTGSPGTRIPPTGPHHYIPNSIFHPMNRTDGQATAASTLYHASSVESIQSLQSFHSFPGYVSGNGGTLVAQESFPSTLPVTSVHQQNNVYITGQTMSQKSNKEWYQSDSEASNYASGDDTIPYKQNFHSTTPDNPTHLRHIKYKSQMVQQPHETQQHQRYNYCEATSVNSWYKNDEDNESVHVQFQPGGKTDSNLQSEIQFSSQPKHTPIIRSPTYTVQNQLPQQQNTIRPQMSGHMFAPYQTVIHQSNATLNQQPKRIVQNSLQQEKQTGVAFFRNLRPQSYMSATSRPVMQFAIPYRPQVNLNAGNFQSTEIRPHHHVESVSSSHPVPVIKQEKATTHLQDGSTYTPTYIHGVVKSYATPYVPNTVPNKVFECNNQRISNSLQANPQQLAQQSDTPKTIVNKDSVTNLRQIPITTNSLPAEELKKSHLPVTVGSDTTAQLLPVSHVQYTPSDVTSSRAGSSISRTSITTMRPPDSDLYDVNVTDPDPNWVDPRAQVRAEHQTRMGFLYRDMNLKTSQC